MTISEMNQIRQQKGLTYQDISVATGISISTIQKVLGGFTKNPRIETVQKLEQAILDSPSTMLLRDSGIPFGVEGTAARKIPEYFTKEDRNRLPQDRRTELLDGVLYDMASPTLNHQRVIQGIYNQIYECMNLHPSDCELFLAPVDVELAGPLDTVLVPDLVIVCDPDKTAHRNVEGAPDFVLEVLSPSTAYRDKFLKLNKYANSGVREYWIVDIARQKAYVYLFEKETPDKSLEGGNEDKFSSDEQAAGVDYDIETYSFRDKIPVGISGGRCEIDMSKIAARLRPEA